jgi:adenylate kinase family enzyme
MHKKIAVVGCAGSGKTHLAFALHKKLQIPLYHLDQYYWLPDWERVQLDKFKIAHDSLCDKDSWIIEGSYVKFFPYRAQQADVIIYTDLPRYLCMWYVLKRSWTHWGEVIPGNPEGCKQRILSWKFVGFLQWVWTFNKRYRNMILDILDQQRVTKKVYVLKSFQEMDDFVRKI